MASFIKKIVTIVELNEIFEDIKKIFSEDNEIYTHGCDLKHDGDLILKSLSHESLLMWNTHVWSHFNGKNWDALFIGIIRKSEKFNKKIMDEYLWLSKNPKAGIKLMKTATEFAKKNGAEYILMNVIENHKLSKKVKNFYLKSGFTKDSETYIKKL
jgi:hypothetical protein